MSLQPFESLKYFICIAFQRAQKRPTADRPDLRQIYQVVTLLPPKTLVPYGPCGSIACYLVSTEQSQAVLTAH